MLKILKAKTTFRQKGCFEAGFLENIKNIAEN
jgi:hypothetical protein